MILKVGEYGINSIVNYQNRSELSSIMIYKGITFSTAPTADIMAFPQPKLYLGCHEISCCCPDDAIKLFEFINLILTVGEPTKESIEAFFS